MSEMCRVVPFPKSGAGSNRRIIFAATHFKSSAVTISKSAGEVCKFPYLTEKFCGVWTATHPCASSGILISSTKDNLDENGGKYEFQHYFQSQRDATGSILPRS